MAPSDRPGSGVHHEEYQTLILQQTDDGSWRVTQDGMDLVGRGENPGRAVQNLGELVAETAYEGGGERASD